MKNGAPHRCIYSSSPYPLPPPPKIKLLTCMKETKAWSLPSNQESPACFANGGNQTLIWVSSALSEGAGPTSGWRKGQGVLSCRAAAGLGTQHKLLLIGKGVKRPSVAAAGFQELFPKTSVANPVSREWCLLRWVWTAPPSRRGTWFDLDLFIDFCKPWPRPVMFCITSYFLERKKKPSATRPLAMAIRLSLGVA